MPFNEELFGGNAHPIYSDVMFAMGTNEKGVYDPAVAATVAELSYIIGRVPSQHRNNGVSLTDAIKALQGEKLVQRVKGSLHDYVLTNDGRELVPELLKRKSLPAAE